MVHGLYCWNLAASPRIWRTVSGRGAGRNSLERTYRRLSPPPQLAQTEPRITPASLDRVPSAIQPGPWFRESAERPSQAGSQPAADHADTLVIRLWSHLILNRVHGLSTGRNNFCTNSYGIMQTSIKPVRLRTTKQVRGPGSPGSHTYSLRGAVWLSSSRFHCVFLDCTYHFLHRPPQHWRGRL